MNEQSYLEIMNSITEYSAEVRVLYAEDDAQMRESAAKLFKRLFKRVDVFADGDTAWEAYLDGHYDIVITDLHMPGIDGIELTRRIKEREYFQMVVITSAYNDTDHLFPLINLGVDAFLAKPLDNRLVMQTFYRLCRQISESRLLEEFREKLEASYIELIEKNEKLEKAAKKIKREENKNIALMESVQKNGCVIDDKTAKMLSKQFEQISAQEFFDSYPTDLDMKNDHLEQVDEQLDITINTLKNDPTLGHLHKVSEAFRTYAAVVDGIPEFSNISYALAHLADVLDGLTSLEGYHGSSVADLMLGVSSTLVEWRKTIFEIKEVENIHYMDNGLVSDCITLEGMLGGREIDSGEDIELF